MQNMIVLLYFFSAAAIVSVASHLASFTSNGYEIYILLASALMFSVSSAFMILSPIESLSNEQFNAIDTKSELRSLGQGMLLIPIFSFFLSKCCLCRFMHFAAKMHTLALDHKIISWKNMICLRTLSGYGTSWIKLFA